MTQAELGRLVQQAQRLEASEHWLVDPDETGGYIITGDPDHGDVPEVEIDGAWYSLPEAVELTRAAIYEAELRLGGP